MPDSEKKQTFRDRINDVYRIEILDLDTLQKVFTFSGKPKTIITILIASFILLFVLFYVLFAFTPLKKTMPGYGDIQQNSEFLQLRKKIVELEEELEAQEVYTDGLRVLLSNDTEGIVKLSEQSLAEEAQKVEQNRKVILAANDTKTTQNEVTSLSAKKKSSSHLTSSPSDQRISKAKINEAKHTKALDNLYFVTPVSGIVSAGFDVSINHFGTDIVAPKNTPIKSISSGVVVSADWTRETGNTISIQHQNNIIAHYKHNSSLLKEVGDFVSAGEAIAIIGNTGELTDGPHLHFELWYNGVPVNPENFFSFK